MVTEAKKTSMVVAAPDETLSTGLERMAQVGVGSILVIDSKGQIAGILTERDLVKHWRQFSDPAFGQTPIGTLATKPVFTLTLDTMADAPLEMLRRKIRHIPLTDDQGRILGVISMRDVLEFQLRAGTLPKIKRAPAKDLPECTLHLLAPSGQVADLCRRSVPSNWRVSTLFSGTQLAKASELALPGQRRHAAFVIDLDGFTGLDWRSVVRRFVELLGASDQSAVFLVLATAGLSERDRQVLSTVASKARWHLYQRPLPIGAFAQDLHHLNEELDLSPAKTIPTGAA